MKPIVTEKAVMEIETQMFWHSKQKNKKQKQK
jgi:hypothetical protein